MQGHSKPSVMTVKTRPSSLHKCAVKTGLLSLGSRDGWGWIILGPGGPILSSTPDLCPLDASGTLPKL